MIDDALTTVVGSQDLQLEAAAAAARAQFLRSLWTLMIVAVVGLTSTADRRLWTGRARELKTPSTGKLDFEVEAAWQRGRREASSQPADTADLPV